MFNIQHCASRVIQHSTLKTQHSNWSLMFTRLNKMECKVRTKLDVNIQNSTLRTAHNSTSAQPTTQHSTLNIAVGFNSQSQALAENNSTFNTQNSTLRFALRASRFTFASWHRPRRPSQSVQSLAAHRVPHASRLSSYS